MSLLDASILDPARPLRIFHAAGGPTVAVMPTYSPCPTTHLSKAEAAYAATIPIPRRQAEWVAGRVAAKHAVQAHCQRHFDIFHATADIVVRTVDSGVRTGMPVVDYPVGISISHSSHLAVAACTSGPVGIDLERHRVFAPRLVAELGTPLPVAPGDWRPRLDTMGTPLRWACREAVLKYFGFGLRIDPREVQLTCWHSSGSFHWRAGPRLRHGARGLRWPRRAWAIEGTDYSLAVVW